ncbi:Spermatogenesis-Associated Protein 13 [Manis pentadactyla]|nr:Spermatogenesis-Associated Protein 13 [Manis pentadactyla]
MANQLSELGISCLFCTARQNFPAPCLSAQIIQPLRGPPSPSYWARHGRVGFSRGGPLGADKVGFSGQLEAPLHCPLATPPAPRSPCHPVASSAGSQRAWDF